jgi:hypothetical protein
MLYTETSVLDGHLVVLHLTLYAITTMALSLLILVAMDRRPVVVVTLDHVVQSPSRKNRSTVVGHNDC